MDLPEGFFDPNDKRVCKLNKSLYGLKQAPRQWNAKLTEALASDGFVQSKSDYPLFTKSGQNYFIALLVYVDDIIITGNNEDEIKRFKVFLQTQFMIKDLGILKYFLGIEVINTNNGVCLNQRKYCLDLISEFGLLAGKPISVPLDPNVHLSSEDSENDPVLKNITEYQRLIGRLIYLTHTRPDIAYTVHCLSQFMHKPLNSHLKVALRVLRYLKAAPGKGIHICKSSNLSLKAFVDSDWAKCISSRRSVIGYCVFFCGNLVSWKSKKQNTVSKSSTKGEYRAMAFVTCEVIWIVKILEDLLVKNVLPIKVFCDSKSAIKIAANSVFHERKKHLEIDLHFVREKILAGVVKIKKIDAANNIADILTKGLDKKSHDFLCNKLTLLNVFENSIKGGC
uniref:uncharacterized mitochondrial protein AtMg00810-like n=1 Tax=Erigeron canadensis TaxID=72917 RepID=UPI001CB8CA83|nr:uncharacterized mitochondrial protein AtMg00810-like [Erigeron canadensis]